MIPDPPKVLTWRLWTPAEDDQIRAWYGMITNVEIADRLVRSPDAVGNRARHLGISDVPKKREVPLACVRCKALMIRHFALAAMRTGRPHPDARPHRAEPYRKSDKLPPADGSHPLADPRRATGYRCVTRIRPRYGTGKWAFYAEFIWNGRRYRSSYRATAEAAANDALRLMEQVRESSCVPR